MDADITGQAAMRGRFALYPQDQGAVIAYVTDLCATCQECECGTRQEPLDLTPRGIVSMGSRLGKLRALRGMIRL